MGGLHSVDHVIPRLPRRWSSSMQNLLSTTLSVGWRPGLRSYPGVGFFTRALCNVGGRRAAKILAHLLLLDLIFSVFLQSDAVATWQALNHECKLSKCFALGIALDGANFDVVGPTFFSASSFRNFAVVMAFFWEKIYVFAIAVEFRASSKLCLSL